jgi:hypothetical protein
MHGSRFSFFFQDYVKKCKSIDNFRQALIDSMKFDNMDLLIEEFYDGHELDIDMLVQNNKVIFIGISDNFKPLEPDFFETGNACPSMELNEKETKAIERLMYDWIPRLKLQNASLHFEVLCRPVSLYPNRHYDVEKPFENVHEFFMPIEMNFRGGGAATWSMNYAAYGVNLSKSYVDLMLGMSLDENLFKAKQNNHRAKCISNNYFPSQTPCKVKSISVDIEKVCKSQNIVEIALFTPVGHVCSKDDFITTMSIKGSVDSTPTDLFRIRAECSSLIQYEFIDETK